MSGSSYYNASSTKGNFQGAEDAADLRPVPTNRSDSDRGAQTINDQGQVGPGKSGTDLTATDIAQDMAAATASGERENITRNNRTVTTSITGTSFARAAGTTTLKNQTDTMYIGPEMGGSSNEKEDQADPNSFSAEIIACRAILKDGNFTDYRFPKQGILQDLTFHLPMADWNNGCVAYMPDANEINANQMTSAMCAVTPFAKAFRAFGETADAELSSDNPTGVGRGTQGIKTKPQRLTIAFEATDIAGDKADRKMEVKMMCTKFGLTKGQRFEKSDPASGLKRGTDYYFCSFNAGPGA